MTLQFTGKYSEDRQIIKKLMIRFGNLSISTLKEFNTGSRTMSNSINITPVLSFDSCHLGGCNLPGDGLQIPHSNIKDCDMNITDTEEKENPMMTMLDDLFLRLYTLREYDREEVKRFREYGIERITKLRAEFKNKFQS